MSKAEERALEVYPPKLVTYSDLFGEETLDDNGLKRTVFIEGYNQAEKDLSLTWEDIERIHTFLYAIKHNKQGVFTFTRLSDEQYQEVLKRFKNLKK